MKRTEIPPQLLTLDFCIAWEEFKAHFDWINQEYWLHHFFVIGPERAIKEMEKEIEIEMRKT